MDDLRTILQVKFVKYSKTEKGAFLAKIELSPPTIRDAIRGEFCTAKTAKILAEAIGFPNRWNELVTDREEKRDGPSNQR